MNVKYLGNQPLGGFSWRWQWKMNVNVLTEIFPLFLIFIRRKDVAAATFMATATTTPEFFTNVISTFVTESDIGLGTIIGSLMFNTLGVAAVASLAVSKPVQLDWWPITRDSILYGSNILLLIIFAWDNVITLQETIIMVSLFFVYFVVLFQNKRVRPAVKWFLEDYLNCCRVSSYGKCRPSNNRYMELNVFYNFRINFRSAYILHREESPKYRNHAATEYSKTSWIGKEGFAWQHINVVHQQWSHIYDLQEGQSHQIGRRREKNSQKSVASADVNTLEGNLVGVHMANKMYFDADHTKSENISSFISAHVSHVHHMDWPECVYDCLDDFSDWWVSADAINAKSYLNLTKQSHSIFAGYTFKIPDAVMGLTFLAAGGCMPEGISSVLMVRKGEGGVGVSNSLGANSLAILMSLGIPWLIRNILHRNDPGQESIHINSYGIEYTILLLFLAVVALYLILTLSRYRLKRTVGISLVIVYLVIITFGVLLELNVFFPTAACAWWHQWNGINPFVIYFDLKSQTSKRVSVMVCPSVCIIKYHKMSLCIYRLDVDDYIASYEVIYFCARQYLYLQLKLYFIHSIICSESSRISITVTTKRKTNLNDH